MFKESLKVKPILKLASQELLKSDKTFHFTIMFVVSMDRSNLEVFFNSGQALFPSK